MNIFALDQDPAIAAQSHCDKHVNKMLLEGVQILNTALHQRNLSDFAFYSATHTNHPCVLWAAESWANFEWLLRLIHHLNKEYKFRYDHEENHTSYQKVLDNWHDGESWSLPAVADEQTSFAQAMPDDVTSSDAIAAYRDYYREHKSQEDWFTFDKGREPPEWLQ